MKIHELISFAKDFVALNRVQIQSCYKGSYPYFLGSVTNLLVEQYHFLDLPVVNATYNTKYAQLDIFYNPEDLGEH